MHVLQSIRRALGVHHLPLFALAICLGAVALPASTAQIVPPQPTQPAQPTLPPVPTVPGFPTQPPQPTQPPVPTVPPLPTERPTVAPTAEPTAPPTAAPTEVPTEIPTQEPTVEPVVPTPPPPVAPTQPPAPQPAAEANVTCTLAGEDDLATPTALAETGPWTLYTCALDLDFGPVASLTLQGETDTPGWRVILAEPDAPNTPGLLNASNARLELDDLDGESSASFLLGVQSSCTAFKAATIGLDITATRPGEDGGTVETGAAIPLALPAEQLPTVTLDGLTITGENDATLVSLDLTYDNAPTACPWQVLVTLNGAGTVTIDTLAGPDASGLAAATTVGLVTITVPPADATGTLGLMLRLAEAATLDTILIEPVTFP